MDERRAVKALLRHECAPTPNRGRGPTAGSRRRLRTCRHSDQPTHNRHHHHRQRGARRSARSPSSGSTPSPEQQTGVAGTVGSTQEDESRIEITIGDERFQATLDDSAASRDLLAQLPVTVDMTDHGTVEKTGAPSRIVVPGWSAGRGRPGRGGHRVLRSPMLTPARRPTSPWPDWSPWRCIPLAASPRSRRRAARRRPTPPAAPIRNTFMLCFHPKRSHPGNTEGAGVQKPFARVDSWCRSEECSAGETPDSFRDYAIALDAMVATGDPRADWPAHSWLGWNSLRRPWACRHRSSNRPCWASSPCVRSKTDLAPTPWSSASTSRAPATYWSTRSGDRRSPGHGRTRWTPSPPRTVGSPSGGWSRIPGDLAPCLDTEQVRQVKADRHRRSDLSRTNEPPVEIDGGFVAFTSWSTRVPEHTGTAVGRLHRERSALPR